MKDGQSIDDIQRRLKEEFEIGMTYMDVRFMLLDLDLAVQDKPDKGRGAAAVGAADKAQPEQESATQASPTEIPGTQEGQLIGGNVEVDVDRVTKPGALVSGSVVFSDGVKAAWALDQFGRMTVSASQPGYQPPQEDLEVFQDKLRAALESRGM